MTLTKKVQIYPTHAVIQILWRISYLCTQLWNAALEQRQDKKSWGKINVYTQKKQLPDIKRAFPEFKWPSSQVLQNVLFKLAAAYKMFFTKLKEGDKEVRPPKFKSCKFFFTQEYSQNGVSFVIDDNILKLAFGSKPADWLQVALPDGSYDLIKTVQILHDQSADKWYACLTYQVTEPELKTEGEIIYFDPGCKTTLTGIKTTGEFVEYDLNLLREVNISTYKFIDDLTSQRDTKKKGSYHWKRLNQKIKKLYRKINTRSKMYLHTLANQILKDHPDAKAFLIGNWKKKDTLANTGHAFVNKRVNRAVQNNNPLEKLIGYLTYKAKLRGQAVEKFDEKGTTRTCSQCNHVHENGISPAIRTFVCENCGFSFSRDHHSCLNFIKKFQSALWQRLSGHLPDCSVRTTLKPFSLKLQVVYRPLAS